MSYTIEDLKSETYSYSRLDTFVKCPMKFDFKYIQKYRTDSSSIALQLGGLCHEILEDKFEYIKNNKKVQYKKLLNKFNEKSSNFTIPCEYEDRLIEFNKRILSKENIGEWVVFSIEEDIYFEFEGYELIAKIDRIDINKDGDYRIIDYKTNKKLFQDSDLTTSLQMYIYALAIKDKYGKFPIEFIYDMLFLNEKQYAMTKGWENRGCKKLKKIFDDLELCFECEEFHPKQTPLCYFCDYCNNNPNKDEWYGNACEYYSLWTRENPSYKKIQEWEGMLR